MDWKTILHIGMNTFMPQTSRCFNTASLMSDLKMLDDNRHAVKMTSLMYM